MSDTAGVGTAVCIITVHPDGSVVFAGYAADVDAVLAVLGEPVVEAVLSAEDCATLSAHTFGAFLVHEAKP